MNMLFPLDIDGLQRTTRIHELELCNQTTRRYGLWLSEQQIETLAGSRRLALKTAERVEFGNGVLKDIIIAFCSSPYLSQDTYESTLLELQDLFYQCKDESFEQVSDEELIETMRSLFDEKAHGSMDYLATVLLDEFCRDVRDEAHKEEIAEDLFEQTERGWMDDTGTPRREERGWFDDIDAPGWDGESWMDDDEY